MEKGFQILGDTFRGIFSLLYEAIFPPRTKVYDARFTNPSYILKHQNKGWAIGTRALPLDFQGFMVVAASGVGKTSLSVLPGLIRQAGNGSIVVLDPSGELYDKVSGWFQKHGVKIFVLNFSDPDGYFSDGWNPFPSNKSEVAHFCTLITDLALGENTRDPFWSLQAASLLAMLSYTLFAIPEEFRVASSLNDLLAYLAAKPEMIDKWMSKYADESNWIEYLAFMRNSDNTRASIISSARSVLTVFVHDHIRRITSRTSFDLKSIREKQSIIFLQTNGAELQMYKLLISLFFAQLISMTLKEIPKKGSQPIHLMLEEGGIYRIPILPLAITQCRKALVNTCLIVQSQSQLYHLYSKEEATTLISNLNSKLFLSNADLQTARELSELTGTFTYRDEDNHLKNAPLLTTQEVKGMPIGSGLLLYGNLPPSYIENITPYYKDSKMNQITSLTPVPIDRKLPIGDAPRLPIEKLLNQ